ncbi:MAG TPA: EcsC family protein [Methylocella sp.]|nr:EcsC family protein [Methylocella sp.]
MNSLVSADQWGSENLDFPPGASRLSPEDRAALERAMQELERSSFAIRLTALFGRQVSALASMMPAQLAEAAGRAADAAVRNGLAMALRSLAGKPLNDRRRLHKGMAALAGAAGGAFGLATLPVELPFSTMIMLRSIADIARSEGHDLADPRAVLGCLEVFALGGHTGPAREQPMIDEDEPAFRNGAFLKPGYFAVRAILAKTVTEAAGYLTGRSIVNESAPALVRLVAQIGSHFGVAVSQKLVAQTLPIIGAAGGAAINYAFADHFQTVARGHFTVMRLERRYGARIVRAEYEKLRRGA